MLDSDSEHEPENLNLVDKFKESVNHFEDEISHSKTINSDSDSIQQLLHIFSEILEDGFERRDSGNNDPHYWFTVSSILDTIPMRFVNSLEKFTTDNEKAYVWILIELHKKNLLNILNDILKTPQIMQYYKERAIIRVNTQKIQDISSKLCRLDYTIESKFLKVYEENKNDFEDNSEDGSVVVRDNTALSQNENWADKLYHHSRISEGSNDSPGFSPEFKKTGNQQIDNTNNMTQSQPLPVIKPVKVDDVKQSLERYKNLLKRPTIIGREEEEQEVFVREGYKQELEEKNKFNPFMFVSKVIDPVNRFKNLLPAAQQVSDFMLNFSYLYLEKSFKKNFFL